MSNERQNNGGDWVRIAEDVSKILRERAARYDETDDFVQDNYATLKEHRLFWAGIPAEQGGGGATHTELCRILQALARGCGSTALSTSMHMHPVAANVFKHLRGAGGTPMLEKVAAEELVVCTTGANDWLDSSGTLTKVDGGFRMNAHKRFVSGSPGADLFATSCRYDNPETGRTEVLHLGIPMTAEGIQIEDVWRTHGMRGTGSQDVILKDVFVPDAAVAARRPAGEWHGMYDVIVPVAMSLIMSVYRGIAEEAAAIAGAHAKKKQDPAYAQSLGALQTSLVALRLAHDDMVRYVDDYRFQPSLEGTSGILARKTIATEAAIATVELAKEIVGGAAFFRAHPLERLARDVRAAHFHPLPRKKQELFSGRVALGLDPV